jgi:hypothetical protein
MLLFSGFWLCTNVNQIYIRRRRVRRRNASAVIQDQEKEDKRLEQLELVAL